MSRKHWTLGIMGIMLALFLILHLGINLTSLISREAYESTWKFMRENTFSKSLIFVLAFGFLTHIIYGIILAMEKIRNSKKNLQGETELQNLWKTLISLGSILIGLLAIHLSHFWAKIQLQGESPYDISRTLFYNGLYTAIYIIWLIALYYYLSYGFWHLFQPVNTKNSKLVGFSQKASQLFAILIVGGFIVIPVFFYLGLGYE